MSSDFELNAQPRSDVGKGASRRLRRQGLVPAVIYGAKQEPENLLVSHAELIRQLGNEGFYSQILNIKVGGRTQRAILRDLQRHPYKPTILHMDLFRISEDQQIRVQVPIHFLNEEDCRGVKQEGGAVSHVLNEIEISCLPKDLPEFIEVDLLDLGLGETIHLSDLKLAEGLEIVQLSYGNDATVANVHHIRVAEEPSDDELEGEAGDEPATPAADEGDDG